MKRVVSISLGSSTRNGQVMQDFNGSSVNIERIGTDGDKEKAIQLIRELDGKVDAFGMGGTDLYIYAGNRRYTFRESAQIAAAAVRSPIVDGSGIKNTLERRVVTYLEQHYGIDFSHKKILLVCAVDRFGMAEAFVEAGGRPIFGDLMFGLGLPIPIRSLDGLARLARMIAPVITQLPIHLFYPTGIKQTECVPRFERYFADADVVAGDFHFIRRYAPQRLDGKMIITNTVTADDEKMLKQRGVGTLVTTTPEMGGRTFGTNILEGVLVALSGKNPIDLTVQEYRELLDQFNIVPRIKTL